MSKPEFNLTLTEECIEILRKTPETVETPEAIFHLNYAKKDDSERAVKKGQLHGAGFYIWTGR